MQPPTVREVTNRLRSEGFRQVRQSGSHQRWERDGKRVTVAGKPSEHLKERTWKSIKEQAGW